MDTLTKPSSVMGDVKILLSESSDQHIYIQHLFHGKSARIFSTDSDVSGGKSSDPEKMVVWVIGQYTSRTGSYSPDWFLIFLRMNSEMLKLLLLASALM